MVKKMMVLGYKNTAQGIAQNQAQQAVYRFPCV